MSLKSSEESREPEKSDTFDDLHRLEQETEAATLKLPSSKLLRSFSEREKEIFYLRASGLSASAIANVMGEEVDQIRYELHKVTAQIRSRAREIITNNRQESEELLTLTVSQKEVQALTAKVLMILTDARQSEDKVTEDQQEIDKLKMETRQILERLRAA